MTEISPKDELNGILNDLAEVVAIKSVYSQPEDGAPYGKECKRALEWFIAKAKSYGLHTQNIGDRCAIAEVGEGKECIGILAHLDVVPAGNGWATDPFKMVEEGGKVYGRGVGDDKGAVAVCLHVLKTVKESGVKLPRRIRLIVGTDEERGSSCMEYYVASGNELPVMSFVPDSEYPVINSEKGIAHIKLVFDDRALYDNIGYIEAAECGNAVPDRCVIKVRQGSALEKALRSVCGGNVTDDVFTHAPAVGNLVSAGARADEFEIYNLADGIKIIANGTAEHASTPEKGDSALWKMFAFLDGYAKELGLSCVGKVYDMLCTPLAAQKLGVYIDDGRSGDTTMCVSMANFADGKLELHIDFRLPLGETADFVAGKLADALGCEAVVESYKENLYIPEDAPLVKTLLSVYRDITGDMTPPLKVGGGTYAREMPNAVAFGSTPNDIDINMHRADENFPIVWLQKNYEIYLAAAVKLAGID